MAKTGGKDDIVNVGPATSGNTDEGNTYVSKKTPVDSLETPCIIVSTDCTYGPTKGRETLCTNEGSKTCGRVSNIEHPILTTYSSCPDALHRNTAE